MSDAIVKNLFDGWAGQQAAVRPRIKWADGVVVGIEQEIVLRMKRFVVGQESFQHETFQKTNWCAPCAISLDWPRAWFG